MGQDYIANVLDSPEHFVETTDKQAADGELQKEMEDHWKRLVELHGGTSEMLTANKIPDNHINFWDEIFKAGDEVLNNLLKALNEHIYNNGIKVKSPVISFFSASNEIPNLNNLEEKPLRAVRPLRLQGTHQICRRLGKPYESLTPKTAE
jgi:MoxR-like ATPase